VRVAVLATTLAIMACFAIACGGDSGGAADAVGDAGDVAVQDTDAKDAVPDDASGDLAETGTDTEGPEDAPDGEDPGDAIEAADGGDLPETTPGFHLIDLTRVGNVRAMWASQEGEVYAVGDHGLVLRFNGRDLVPLPPPPTDADLFGVAGEGGAVYVVGAGGAALRWQGGAWTDLKPASTRTLYGVGVLSASEAYAVGEQGTILHYESGFWSDASTGITHDLFGAYASVVGGVWAVGANGTLLELKGSVWLMQQIAGPLSKMRSIWRAPDGKMFAVGTLGAVAVKDGLAWKLQVTNETHSPPRDLYGVFGLSGKEVYAVGDQGIVLKYDGKKWGTMNVSGPYNTFADLRGVAGFLAPDGTRRLFAAGLDSAGLELDDKSWADRKLGVTTHLRGVTVRGDGTAVAVGDGGLVLEDADGRFGAVPAGVEADLASVSRDYAVGAAGTLLRWKGGAWQEVASGTVEDLTDVWAVEDGAVVVGAGGSVLRVAGAEVFLSTDLVGFPLSAVCALPGGKVVAAGAAGRVFRDAGSGFEPYQTGTSATLHDLWCDDEDAAVAVGDNGVVLACDGAGCVRVHEDPPTFLYGIGGPPGGTVLIAGWAGKVLRLDAGPAVAPMESGTYRVLRSVAGGASGRLHLVGEDGTWITYDPL
jgi:hypothetical protein